jgi:ribonuclease T2
MPAQGFVLHGLWPENANNSHPANCATSFQLDEASRAAGKAVFPNEHLIAHEWQTHGTCSGLSPGDYFAAADNARKSVTVPSELEPGSKTRKMSAKTIASALRAANPALTAQSLAVVCTQGELAEVRICLSKSLQPMSCGTGTRNSCGAGAVRVLGAR